MKKKFKVRVSYFGRGRYTVDYCEYFFIPLFWKSLCFWFEQTLTSGTQCWSTKLYDVKKAEEIAGSIKSIKDVDKYYEKDILECVDFYKRQAAYYKEMVPYKKNVVINE